MKTCKECKWCRSCIMAAPDGSWEACEQFEEKEMDLIDREQALKAIERLCEKNTKLIDTWLVNSLETIIDELPSAEKTGKWVFTGEYYFMNRVWGCNQCGWEVVDSTNYCPNCGARMEEE